MSTFTARSTTHEIPRQFFSTLKTHAFGRLRELANSSDAAWKDVTHAISEWNQPARDEEVNMFRNKNPDADSHYRYSVLRTVKTLQHSEGNTNLRMRAQDLDLIDMVSFFAAFMGKLATCPDVIDNKERFLKLTPTDRNLIAEDVFRSVIYGVAHDIKSRLVGEESHRSRHSRAAPSQQAHTTSEEELQAPHAIAAQVEVRATAAQTAQAAQAAQAVQAAIQQVRADDSISVAPSEAVSEVNSRATQLNAQILSLHNASHNSKKSQTSHRASQRASHRTSKKGRVPSEFIAPVSINLDVPSTTTSKKHRPKSKFSRSPPPKKSPSKTEKPRFFESEVSRGIRSVSTRVTHF